MSKSWSFGKLSALVMVSALGGASAFADVTKQNGKQCSVAEFRMALRYQQQSAEVRALQLQAYNIATEKLEAAVAAANGAKNLAIVSDLDETVIDNSALLARDLADCHSYDSWDTWLPWERDGQPSLIPGAKKFLERANSLGVTIRYVSDRSEQQKNYTLATLQQLGLPQVSADSVLLLGPPKAERRAMVAKDYRIVLQLGDSLHDFDGRYRKSPVAQQRDGVDEQASKWGSEWIVLPNAGYGTWSKEPLKAWEAKAVMEKW